MWLCVWANRCWAWHSRMLTSAGNLKQPSHFRLCFLLPLRQFCIQQLSLIKDELFWVNEETRSVRRKKKSSFLCRPGWDEAALRQLCELRFRIGAPSPPCGGYTNSLNKWVAAPSPWEDLPLRVAWLPQGLSTGVRLCSYRIYSTAAVMSPLATTSHQEMGVTAALYLTLLCVAGAGSEKKQGEHQDMWPNPLPKKPKNHTHAFLRP